MSPGPTRRSADGPKHCCSAPIPAPIPRSPLWRSPTSSPGSPGRCSGAAKGSSSGDCPWRLSCWSGQSRSALTDRCGLREAISRSPDSRTPLRKPGLKNGVIRRREVYEHPSAPISILAGRSPPKPDRLQQTDHRRSRIISRRRGGPYGFDSSSPVGIGGAQSRRGGRVARGERADVPPLDAA